MLHSIQVPVAEATLDHYVRTLIVTKLPQPLVKSGGRWHIDGPGIQHADQWQLRPLLGVGGERPGNCCTARKRNELTSLHCNHHVTASLRPSGRMSVPGQEREVPRRPADC